MFLQLRYSFPLEFSFDFSVVKNNTIRFGLIFYLFLFWHLSCLELSELPGPEVWCQILMGESLSTYCQIFHLFLPLFLLLLIFPLCVCYITFAELRHSFFQPLFFLFGFWGFCYYVLWLRDSFLNCVQPTISSSKIFFISVVVIF